MNIRSSAAPFAIPAVPAVLAALLTTATAATIPASHRDKVLADEPVAFWRLQESSGQRLENSGTAGGALSGEVAGRVVLGRAGQPAKLYPDFSDGTLAAEFGAAASYVRIKDPGANSPLDFTKGDSITLEAWVNPTNLGKGQYAYIVGKGRTGQKGFAANNQNYALRIFGGDDGAHVTFLFRDARKVTAGDKAASEANWHRWTATSGFAVNSGWHHVAITYTFGKGSSIRGYQDGEAVKGRWDMGGQSDEGPVVDDDEVWIGSSMGGQTGSTFRGPINEIAIHRTALAAKTLKERFKFIPPPFMFDPAKLVAGKVLIEIIENIPVGKTWNVANGGVADTFTLPAFALHRLPHKYSERGVRADRSDAFLIRASARVRLPAGEHRLLLRSLQAARLFVDGRKVAETAFISGSGDGHGAVDPVPENLPPGLRFLRMGHKEATVTFTADGQDHIFMLEGYIGGKGLKPDVGELTVTRITPEGPQFLLAPAGEHSHSEEGWHDYVARTETALAQRDMEQRRLQSAGETAYWQKRHGRARGIIAAIPGPAVPAVPAGLPVFNEIDRFIGARLAKAGVAPAPLTDDPSFLRRVAVDLTGTVPSEREIRAFESDASPARRANAIERLLNDPAWADNWVSYWQDVLAENPAILKPSLNNSGPFRFWIHESFSDNKPMDRFATELIMMEGSVYGGGPAGFKLATLNDVPMADRAQVLSQAFLGQNLACARCHDAPFHNFKQSQTFSLAAMLGRGTQTVPVTSSLPADANPRARRRIELSIKPGEKVAPAWAFDEFSQAEAVGEFVRDPKDTREQLALHFTNPRNLQFARTLVNRVWQRYLGLGFVEPVDDWEDTRPSHPELLEWLAREFARHGYDLRWLARTIVSSHTYQRAVAPTDDRADTDGSRLFAAPQRRRLTAEQVVDSLFAAVGKDFDSELLTLDNDSRRTASTFLNLGYPKRAWEFASLSNDRDRPALSMPKTQGIVDMLKMFGWRETRQNARSARDNSPNVLQPAALSNGDVSNGRIARLTEACGITDLCLENQPVEALVTRVFRRVLTREPSGDEVAMFTEFLRAGYDERVVAHPKHVVAGFDKSQLLSWSNHLNARATEIKLEIEARARLGDEPTCRLTKDWRERMEDVLWAMINSPEFLFVP